MQTTDYCPTVCTPRSSKNKCEEFKTPGSWGTPKSSRSNVSSPSLYKSFSQSPTLLLAVNDERNQEIKKLREELIAEEDRYHNLEIEIEDLKTKLKEVTDKEEFKRVALSQYHEEIALKEDHIEKLESEMLKMKVEISTVKKENASIQSELDFFYHSKSNNTKETLDQDNEIIALKEYVKSLLEKESNVEKELLKLTEENNCLNIEMVENKDLIKILESKLKTFESKIENLDESMPSYPSLAEEMEPQIILDLKNELNYEKEKIDYLTAEYQSLNEELVKRKDEITNHIKEKTDIHNDLIKSLSDNEKLRAENIGLSEEVAT